MPSVAPVSNAEFRASVSVQPPAASEDPFSLLLNAVTDATPPRADAAPQAERRDDAPPPAPKSKPEPRTETEDRQAKRRADEPEAKPDNEAPNETGAVPVEAAEDETVDENEGGDTDAAVADVLLAVTAEAQAAVTAPEITAATPAVAAAATTPIATEAQVLPVAAATAAIAEISANTPVVAAQAQAALPAIDPRVAAAAAVSAGAKAKVQANPANIQTAPNGTALLEAQAQTQTQAQMQTQPGTVNVQAAAAVSNPLPASLEALSDAVIKHLQLNVSGDALTQGAEQTQKPLPSNAVAPNFALVANVTSVADVRAQTRVESTRAVPLESLGIEIATRAKNGERRFDIRLDPPELGRIDVRLEIDHKGNTQTKLIVERAETLDLLQRDARGLEKALQSAGLKTDAGGLEFSLRQDAQTPQQSNTPQTNAPRGDLAVETEAVAQVAVANASLHAQLRGGVDIRI